MVKRVVKVTIKTFTVPMRSNLNKSTEGFTLLETVTVLFIISLVISIALMSYMSAYPRIQFREKVDSLVNVFEMAAVSADQSNKRYAILIDFFDHSYTLYDVNANDPYDRDNLLEEDIITGGTFNKNCELDYVQFDDSDNIIDGGEAGTALFVVGHNGWNYGGKIVVSDNDGNIYSIIVTRLGKRVKILKGDIELETPEFDLRF